MTVITLSRQYGSGGEEIACQVCAALGYRYFDKQLLNQVVSQEHLTPEQMVDYHEDSYKMRSFLDRLRGYRPCPGWEPQPAKAGVVRANEASEQVGENLLVWVADAAIQAAYREGNIVIVGRGGQAILHGRAGVLHVRVEGPLEERVARVAEQEHSNLPMARQVVLKHDKAAADYLKRFYGANWTDPYWYHMVLNTGNLSLKTAARLVIQAARYLEEEAQPEEPLAVAA